MPPRIEPKAERHQHLPRRQLVLGGDLHGDRHQQRQRADVVHEGGQHRAEPGQRGQVSVGPAFVGRALRDAHRPRRRSAGRG
jgi:hypothetical protein